MASTKRIRRVLVADDDLQISSFVKEALLQEGHFVTVCRDGAEVFKALAASRYGVLVLDIQMPRKTGVEVLLELRKSGDGVPVILMSSFISDEARLACEKIERMSFLQKPFGIFELRAAVEKVAGGVKI